MKNQNIGNEEIEKKKKEREEREFKESIEVLDNLGLIESNEPQQTNDDNKEAHEAFKLKTKVLIVDDNQEFRELIDEIIVEAGYTVIQAQDGDTALKKISEHPDISIIFADLSMPNMNGFQFINLLRTTNIASGTPIVITTALAEANLIDKAKKLGVSSYLIKPVDPIRVLDFVKASAMPMNKKSD